MPVLKKQQLVTDQMPIAQCKHKTTVITMWTHCNDRNCAKFKI
ncbi:MAG: hypothetical protein V7K53_05385 [Nostoc sp.]